MTSNIYFEKNKTMAALDVLSIQEHKLRTDKVVFMSHSVIVKETRGSRIMLDCRELRGAMQDYSGANSRVNRSFQIID